MLGPSHSLSISVTAWQYIDTLRGREEEGWEGGGMCEKLAEGSKSLLRAPPAASADRKLVKRDGRARSAAETTGFGFGNISAVPAVKICLAT